MSPNTIEKLNAATALLATPGFTPQTPGVMDVLVDAARNVFETGVPLRNINSMKQGDVLSMIPMELLLKALMVLSRVQRRIVTYELDVDFKILKDFVTTVHKTAVPCSSIEVSIVCSMLATRLGVISPTAWDGIAEVRERLQKLPGDYSSPTHELVVNFTNFLDNHYKLFGSTDFISTFSYFTLLHDLLVEVDRLVHHWEEHQRVCQKNAAREQLEGILGTNIQLSSKSPRDLDGERATFRYPDYIDAMGLLLRSESIEATDVEKVEKLAKKWHINVIEPRWTFNAGNSCHDVVRLGNEALALKIEVDRLPRDHELKCLYDMFVGMLTSFDEKGIKEKVSVSVLRLCVYDMRQAVAAASPKPKAGTPAKEPVQVDSVLDKINQAEKLMTEAKKLIHEECVRIGSNRYDTAVLERLDTLEATYVTARMMREQCLELRAHESKTKPLYANFIQVDFSKLRLPPDMGRYSRAFSTKA